MNKAFFDAIRKPLFGGRLEQFQVDRINAILDAWDRWGDGDENKLAYILATAHHETGRMRWLREIWGPTSQQRKYEPPHPLAKRLGNTQPGDGKRFMGRGFVHITGRRNYTDWSRRLGMPLTVTPRLAERIDVAARILVEGMMLGTFTGKKLSDYINERGVNFLGARRIVNGTDKAELIRGYAENYRAALRAARRVEPEDLAPARPPVPQPKPTRVPATVAVSGAGVAATGGAVALAAGNGHLTSVIVAIGLVVVFGAIGFAVWRALKEDEDADR